MDSLILDFEKALDTPPHEFLESKLFICGIGGNDRLFPMLKTTASFCKQSEVRLGSSFIG